MKPKFILISGYDHFFGQTRKPWVSLNTQRLIEILSKAGIAVNEMSYDTVVQNITAITDSIVFYTFSQKDNLRAFIKDCMYQLSRQNNTLIPSYELLYCHENKGYQELLKREKGIRDMQSWYLSRKEEATNLNIKFPIVVKTVEGSNGKGVFLAHSRQELLSIVESITPRQDLPTRLDLLRRKYLRQSKTYPYYPDYSNEQDLYQYKAYVQPEQRFILQQFIPGLSHDYRVIIIYNHYYVVKRMVRDGDFRASGAKQFVFDFTPPATLLDTAHQIFARFNSPFLSIDLGYDGTNYYLFEFQALHFGINAIIRGKGYYTKQSSSWDFVEHKAVFEEEIAKGLISYLQDNNLV